MTVEPIPQHVLDAAARAATFALLSLINKALADSGVTTDELSARLGWSRKRVTRTLAGRNTLRLRDVGELCWAIDGSTLDFTLEKS